MEKKEHIYELVDNSKDGKVVAEFWWNGKKVDCSVPGLLDRIKESSFEFTPNQGVAFLENLPNVYKNGYLNIRKKSDAK